MAWDVEDGYFKQLGDFWNGGSKSTTKIDPVTGKSVATGGTTTTGGWGGTVLGAIGAYQGFQEGERAEEMLDMYKDTSAFDMYMKRANMKMKLGDATEATNMRHSAREANRQINAAGGGRLSRGQSGQIDGQYLKPRYC